MSKDRTLVSFDWAAKNLLRRKANYVILEGFLTTLLGKEIKISSIGDAEGGKETEDQKYNRVDILAEEQDGTLIIIELQFTPEIDYFHRMTFGSSKATTDHLEKGMPYSKVRKVYSINIVYFDLGIGKDYIYHGTTSFMGLHYKDELELSPIQKAEFGILEVKDIFPEFYILKIDRFSNDIKDKIDEWMYFFKNSSIRPEFNALGLAEANERLEYSRLSPDEQRIYDTYVDIRRSNESTVYTAKLEGRAEGRAEGILQVAKKMKAEGVALDVILKVTGLSDEDIDSQLPSRVRG
ncbi:MAG: Rpn family recombination-promoting nuclease/putative transposase [Fibromonadaceae bacterium]|nr:Rpn family recombination-promoting nuclease/putative transposase [Fibromonadaceae bacterium]